MKRNQSGFTLIEIAIVLVIIGLLLGGVLKGQELINSARVKNLASDFKNIPVFIYGYQDKFKALPGDDSAAGSHVAATANGNGNGIINGMWDSITAADESVIFWQHVRLAGLAPGETVVNLTTYLPTNAVGGRIGITNATAANLPITGLRGSYIICSRSILGKFAKQMDTTLDDGNTTTGSVMVMADQTAPGTVPAAAVATTAANFDDTPYTVCMGF
ncbi:MAG: prepilin-type N-terminal cleavage/methylation domain-containing protein [Gallionellales bacterium RBG_16_56_9]|nr:MAG: prepilin-type N-terminal cleavage/methylation domain-containing protein [Gallionellales bacterium RBG_16_56_9]